jgi:hypothetical protein
MKKVLIWLAALVIGFGASAVAQKAYTMKDLQVLATNGAWRELAEHLGDIAPAKRDKTWEQLAEKTALGLLDMSVKEQNQLEGYYYAEALLDRYPSIKKSAKVMTKRGDVGLSVHGWCFRNSYDISYCNTSLMTFISKDPQNLDLAFKAGKLVRLNANHSNAVPYFRRALVTPSATRKCTDEDVIMAVVSGLGLPSDYPLLKETLVIVNGPCFKELKAPLLEAIRKDGSGYLRDNGCAALAAKEPQDEEIKSTCGQK